MGDAVRTGPGYRSADQSGIEAQGTREAQNRGHEVQNGDHIGAKPGTWRRRTVDMEEQNGGHRSTDGVRTRESPRTGLE